MANEALYFDCVKSMLDFGVGVVMLGLVPLSNRLDRQQLDVAEDIVKNLKRLVTKSGKLIGIVIDAGIPFNNTNKFLNATVYPYLMIWIKPF